MVEFAFSDQMKRACRFCATFGRAKTKHIFERGLIPRPQDETATVTFIRFEGRTYAVTANHVLKIFKCLAEKEGITDESFFLPSGKGVLIQPPFVRAPKAFEFPEPDAALREIDDDLPSRVGKEAFELLENDEPTYPVLYAGAVGFPTGAKRNQENPIGTRLAMPCVQAVAEGLGAPAFTDQLQFRSEIEEKPDVRSLSGLSGGPAFWSDGERFGLLGFIKEAHDVEPQPDKPHLYAGPRVNFLIQHINYATFSRWVDHAQREWPKLRAELNERAQQSKN